MFKLKPLITHCLCSPLIFALALSASPIYSSYASTPDDWKSGAYAYSADQTSLNVILQDFANGHGVDINIDGLPEETVTARLRSESPEAFLNRLALEYHFQWFVYNNTLYISAQSAQTSRRLKISQDAAPDIKQALEGVGLLEPRFGWGELPDDGVVLVTGPPKYVDLVSEFSKKSEPDEKNTETTLMAFPLKYADVADRSINFRDKKLVVPGVASILNELLGQGGSQSAGGVQDNQGGNAGSDLGDMARQNQMNGANMLYNQMLQRVTGLNAAHEHNGDSDHPELQGKVSADVRNNTLLVRDDKKLRAEYQALINMIDKPQKLVEIDALIVDIDRNELSRLSVDWQGQFGSVTGGPSLLSGATPTLAITDPTRFIADIQALEGEGTASILANPSVLTLENQPAVIDFSKTAFITAIGERVADIQQVTAGTSLRVIPRSIGQIPGKEAVQLVVDVEDGKLNEKEDGSAKSTENGVISTQALVQAKRSLVMGGFHTQQSGDSDSGIPILRKIPFLGRLFSSTNRTTEQRERLFIITPHLIGDQVDPSRYVDADNRGTVSDALQNINRRHEFANSKREIENAMRELAEGHLPGGMKVANSGPSLNALCQSPLTFRQESRQQWYSNDSFAITVGVITNVSGQSQRFDEASCHRAQTLAVSAWPHSELKPGESTEVYIAYNAEASPYQNRASLLQRNSLRSSPVQSAQAGKKPTHHHKKHTHSVNLVSSETQS